MSVYANKIYFIFPCNTTISIKGTGREGYYDLMLIHIYRFPHFLDKWHKPHL